METVERKIEDLIPAEYNPRQMTEKQNEDLKASMKRFGVVEPLLINMHKDRKNIVIGGHQRLRVWKGLGHDTIPCWEIEVNRDRERELNVRLNKNTGEFDWDALANEFDVEELTDWGFDENDLLGDEHYATTVEAPVYEPTGIKPSIESLADSEKVDRLVEKIEASDVSEKEKTFLMEAAQRHRQFDYSLVAEYYAQSDEEMQELMEDSALVIIDFDKAIEQGYVVLTEWIKDAYEKENA